MITVSSNTSGPEVWVVKGGVLASNWPFPTNSTFKEFLSLMICIDDINNLNYLLSQFVDGLFWNVLSGQI